MGNSPSCTLPACRTWGFGTEAPVGASRGGLAFLLTLKHLCSGADHQCPSYESTCVHMASELKANERLYPLQKGEDPCLKLPCVKILFLTSRQYPVRGSHVVTTRKGILTSIFATPVSSQLCLHPPAAAPPYANPIPPWDSPDITSMGPSQTPQGLFPWLPSLCCHTYMLACGCPSLPPNGGLLEGQRSPAPGHCSRPPNLENQPNQRNSAKYCLAFTSGGKNKANS